MSTRKSITDLRLERNISQAELAARSGLSATTVVQAELGRAIFPSTLTKICRGLGVLPEDVDGVVTGRRLGRRVLRKKTA